MSFRNWAKAKKDDLFSKVVGNTYAILEGFLLIAALFVFVIVVVAFWSRL